MYPAQALTPQGQLYSYTVKGLNLNIDLPKPGNYNYKRLRGLVSHQVDPYCSCSPNQDF